MGFIYDFFRKKLRFYETEDGYVWQLSKPMIFGDYRGGNYSLIMPDGSIRHYGDATGWDDLCAPATAINPPGAASDPDWDTTNIGWLFDDASTEVLHIVMQMPHSWEEGSMIYPHVHWMPPSSDTGSVLWRMEYRWTNVGDQEIGAFTTLDVLDAGSGNNYEHQIAAFAGISGTGKTLSSIISIKLSRIGGDASDTFVGDALFKEFDIHYQTDTPAGSEEEYVKFSS